MHDQLEKIKKYLPKGYTNLLAVEFGVTGVTVCKSLKGKTKRFDIIKRAIEMANENLNVQKKLKGFASDLD